MEPAASEMQMFVPGSRLEHEWASLRHRNWQGVTYLKNTGSPRFVPGLESERCEPRLHRSRVREARTDRGESFIAMGALGSAEQLMRLRATDCRPVSVCATVLSVYL